MTNIHSILMLAAVFSAAFFEASFDGFRSVLGAQIDFLPPLMVYAGLNNGFATIVLTGLCGGLCFDSLSMNPLGISVIPLIAIGLGAYHAREILARDHFGTRLFLGAASSAVQPLAVLFILVNIGSVPVLNWKSLWQWSVMIAGGAAFMPFCFAVFDRVHQAFDYQPASFPSFRPDREIKRGRS